MGRAAAYVSLIHLGKAFSSHTLHQVWVMHWLDAATKISTARTSHRYDWTAPVAANGSHHPQITAGLDWGAGCCKGYPSFIRQSCLGLTARCYKEFPLLTRQIMPGLDCTLLQRNSTNYTSHNVWVGLHADEKIVHFSYVTSHLDWTALCFIDCPPPGGYIGLGLA